MINIPTDLRKNKEKIIGPFDARESICLFLGLFFGFGFLYYVRIVIRYKNLIVIVFFVVPLVMPFLIYGFKKTNGMKTDDYIKVFINNNIIATKERINVQSNNEEIIKNKKYELLRYYKLLDIRDLIHFREYLKENKKLILTEYIDYKNEKNVVFRLNGKDLILEQIRRNKEAIRNKNIEIKNFLITEIESLKNKMLKLNKYENTDLTISKKEKLKIIYNKLKELSREKKYLQHKTFNDLKEEVDIFEGISCASLERILFNCNTKLNFNLVLIKKSKNTINNLDNRIPILRDRIKNDDRTLYQLHLFDKHSFKQIINNAKDKFIFIDNDDKVDVYIYELNRESVLVNLNEIDKSYGLYETTILGLEARNSYNHYREINNLMEIL